MVLFRTTRQTKTILRRYSPYKQLLNKELCRRTRVLGGCAPCQTPLLAAPAAEAPSGRRVGQSYVVFVVFPPFRSF